MSEILVIYHRADFDGIFCREIAQRALGHTAKYVGWDYDDPLPEIPDGVGAIYILDLSIEELMGDPRVIWIDHHRTAIEKYSTEIHGYRVESVAACRLTWQWFFSADSAGLPDRPVYFMREVVEPLAVRLAGEYDIWDKRDVRVDLFQHGLRSCEVDFQKLLQLDTAAEEYVDELLANGRPLAYAKAKSNESLIKDLGFDLKFEGRLFLACNAAGSSSDLFAAGMRPEHDGCLSFRWEPRKGAWKVSMRGASKPDIDLTDIATKHGGGGHPRACGFTCATLPFSLS